MLVWASLFFVVAAAAALFGFVVAATAFAVIAKLIFYGAVALFLVTLFGHLMQRV